MPPIVRIAITNQVTGTDFTLKISVGSPPVPINVILDTGSSMLVVAGHAYDPSNDPSATTTQLLQTSPFQSGTFMAAVVRTPVALPVGDGGAPVVVPKANLAVTYQIRSGTFGAADGILGLAYSVLDTAYRMPADTWKARYNADQLGLGQPADLEPYISQAAEAGLISNKFGFAVHRSLPSLALPDASLDPLNGGVFVLGGGAECADLYTGDFASVAVVHETWYNTNLLAVQVGNEAVNVPPAAPGGKAVSNSIIDSGSTVLTLDSGLYGKVIALFGAVDPAFGMLLRANPPASAGCDQSLIDLTKWPPIRFIFQGSEASQVTVTVSPRDYWQFDSVKAGTAVSVIASDNGALAGQSNLGLPMFCGHYVVFDRTATNGHGVVSFATAAGPAVPMS